MDNIRITLTPPYCQSNPKLHPFHPHSPVSGTVILTLPCDENIDSVHVGFKGKIHLQSSNGRDKHWHKITMFSFSQTLFKGPFKMRADKYEYPFEFRFPESWSSRFDVGEFKTHRDIWREFGGSVDADGIGTRGAGKGLEMPLPPSMLDIGPYGMCEIYYRLTASVSRNFLDWEDKATLHFSPYRLEVESDQRQKTAKIGDMSKHVNFKIGDDGIPRPLSMKEMLKHGFYRSGDTKTIHFSLEVKMPTCIVLGKAYPVVLRLVGTDEGWEEKYGEAGKCMPQFVLKEWMLRLKSRTDFRLPGTFVDYRMRLDGHVSLSHGKLDEVLPMGMPKTLQGLFPTSKGLVTPAFLALAVRRKYGLELKVVVECLGDETNLKVVWPEVEVLAETIESQDERAVGEMSGRMEDLNTDRDGLPAYGEYEGRSGTQAGLPSYEAG